MKVRRTFSVVLAVLLLLTVFMSSLSVNAALGSSTPYNVESTLTWSLGQYSNTTGQPLAAGNWFRADEYVPISHISKLEVNRDSTPEIWRNIYYYDKDKNFISSEYSNASIPSTVTSSYTSFPVNTVYARFAFYVHQVSITSTNLSNYSSHIHIRLTPIVDVSQIDSSKKGKVIIHKYETPEGAAQPSTNGTGYSTDVANVPSGSLPLNGATFKLTKVDEISPTYFTPTGTALPTVAQAKAKTAINMYTQTTATVTLNGTQQSGIAIFDNLPLGIYLVQETSSPAHVIEKVADFVISVPSTNKDRNEWKYDFDVYPKNKSKYVDITFEKTNMSTTKLAGAQFTLERKVNGTWERFNNTTYTTSSSAATTLSTLPVGYEYRLTETVAPTGYIKDVDDNKSTFTINSSGVISSVSGRYVTKLSDTSLRIKNSRPSVEKFIDKSRGSSTDLTKDDTSLIRYNDTNDFQYYTVKIATPYIANMSKLKTFKVTDSINYTATEPVVTKVVKGTSSSASGTTLDSSAYTFTATSSDTSWKKNYTTELVFDTSKLDSNSYYYITYKAYLVQTVTNQAKVIYSKSTSSSETETSEITSNSVKYTGYSYKFTKKNESGTALQNAYFRVYATREDAVANKNSLKALRWNSTDGTMYMGSDSSGIVSFSCCFDMDDAVNGQKTFWLAETQAPNGYTLLAEPVEITVTATSGNSSQMDIINTKKIVFPLTGSTGILLIVSSGLLFIGVAVAILVIKKRKNKEIV